MAIDTVGAQSKLKPRRAPYWHRLGVGQHVGFRKAADGIGTWQAKAYDPGTRKETYRSLGDFAQLPAADRFSAAVKAALEWFGHIGRGGRRDGITVMQACQRYVQHLIADKRLRTAKDAAARFARHVAGEPIATIQLSKLKAAHLREWRQGLSAKPALPARRGPNCRVKSAQIPRERSASSINRELASLRAALNLALRDDFATTDSPWRVALKPDPNAGRRRELYLTRDQRRALIESLPADAGAFVRGLCLLPLRPGALAGLKVADFTPRANTLRIARDKAGAGRAILLPASAAALLKEQSKGKLPTAPLFSRWDGRAWDKDAWKGPIKAAAAAAALPPDASAYTLRHSTVTDLVMAGLDLFTVAALSGTSIAMIEKHYGHLQQDRARDALAGLEL